MNALKLSADKRTLHVNGTLDFNSVPLLHDQADQFIHDTAIPTFDFQGVTHAESAALSLLTTWYRKSYALGKTPHFIHLPHKLMDVARLSNLDKVLVLLP